MRPHRFVLRAALAASLAASLACDSPLALPEPDAYLTVRPRQPIEDRTPFAVSAEPGRVSTVGHVTTSDPCFGFGAVVQRDAPRLVITLVARSNSSGCIQPLQEWNYLVTVPEVPSGTWDVRVRTQIDPRQTPVEVIRSSVRVP